MSDSNRLEREIEEILGKIDQFPDAEARRKREGNRALRQIGTAISDRQRAIARELGRFSMSQVMLASFLLMLGSLLFRAGAPLLMEWMLYLGSVLFVTSFAFIVFGGGSGSSSSQPQRWRGRPIEASSGPSLSHRLRGWWEARSRK
ncbi:MAG: hypothetical protein DWI58_03165 [Chloroflexi bacterium]|nr:MAG: hypothetical protein DWI58_03165 [Chloroflexota bacterium]